MASVYQLKSAFQKLLRPVTRLLVRCNITANQITLFAMILSFALGGLIFLFPDRAWVLLAVPPFLLVRMALNAIDGMMAREHDMKSDLGAILNELGDVLSDSAIFLPFAAVPLVDPIPVIIIVVLAVISETAGLIAVQIGASRRYDGPMGKSDRALAFSILAFLLALNVPTDPWLTYALWATAALTGVTIVNRSRKALKEVRNTDN